MLKRKKKINNLLVPSFSHSVFLYHDNNDKKLLDEFDVNYDKSKNICEIFNKNGLISNSGCLDHLGSILKVLQKKLSKKCIIWIGQIQEKDYNQCIQENFFDPYVCKKSPLGTTVFSNKEISFLKYNNNNNNDKYDQNTVIQKIKYLLDYNWPEYCKMYAQFSKKTISNLKKLVIVSNNNNVRIVKVKHPNHELTGSFIVKRVLSIRSKTVFELELDLDSIISGREQDVDVVWSRFNLHTHPKNAYTKNQVIKGWPSGQDYVGFLTLNNHTIFHTVVTLEGVYIISMSSEFKGNKKDVDEKFVLANFNIDHKSKLTYDEYVHHINTVQYKNMTLFYVQFLAWKKTSSTIFDVYYANHENMCLSTDSIFKLTRDLQKRI